MPDLHGWISQAVTKREALARRASKVTGRWVYALELQRVRDGDYVVANTGSAYGWHIEANDPAAVLRRCAADRKILEVHAYSGGSYEPYACAGCGHDDMGALVEHCNDCETLQALAEGYGITDEELAQLERPEVARREATGKPLSEALAEAFDRFSADRLDERYLGDLSAHKFTGLLPIATELLPPTPLERALDILRPHLHDVPLYRPTA
ncbi:DUF6221 family protein [Streptomyces sp. NPDC001194]|uniref:DUF6221 family protein n=1 Tax=Streptomyces sp. NPDC001194 TaxID=3364547 RepID=UPI0036CA67D7